MDLHRPKKFIRKGIEDRTERDEKIIRDMFGCLQDVIDLNSDEKGGSFLPGNLFSRINQVLVSAQ